MRQLRLYLWILKRLIECITSLELLKTTVRSFHLELLNWPLLMKLQETNHSRDFLKLKSSILHHTLTSETCNRRKRKRVWKKRTPSSWKASLMTSLSISQKVSGLYRKTNQEELPYLETCSGLVSSLITRLEQSSLVQSTLERVLKTLNYLSCSDLS